MVHFSSVLTPRSKRLNRGTGQLFSHFPRLLTHLLWAALISVVTFTKAYAQGGTTVSGFGGFWQQAAAVIVQPWVTVALLVVGCLLLFLDLLTPRTWEIRGSLGILFLGLIFAANITVGTGGWVGVLLSLGGIALLLLELHLFPGHGAALGGLILLFAGTFWALGGPQNGIFAFSIATVVTIVSIFAFFAYLPRSSAWKEMGKQIRLSSLHQLRDAHEHEDSRLHLLGHTARTITPLRPSGHIEVAGTTLFVVTENEFIEKGASVIVTQIEGKRIVVDRADSERVSVPLTAHR